MTKIDDGPCKTCGGSVRLVHREDRRLSGTEKMTVRVCTNPQCRMNGPRSGRRLSDSV